MIDASSIMIVRPVPEHCRHEAALLYLEAFWGKLRRLLGEDLQAAAKLFAPKLKLDQGIAAMDENRLVGLAGFKDHAGSFFDATLADMQGAFGWFGGLWRGLLLSLLERDQKPNELLMDGILVASDRRGLGIGTKLLDAIEVLAIERQSASIRLDVIDTNPAARRLYERRGFVPVKTENVPYLRPLFGFSSSTQMQKPLLKPEQIHD